MLAPGWAYDPALHSEHVLAPGRENVPCGHLAHCLQPPSEYSPASQSLQMKLNPTAERQGLQQPHSQKRTGLETPREHECASMRNENKSGLQYKRQMIFLLCLVVVSWIKEAAGIHDKFPGLSPGSCRAVGNRTAICGPCSPCVLPCGADFARSGFRMIGVGANAAKTARCRSSEGELSRCAGKACGDALLFREGATGTISTRGRGMIKKCSRFTGFALDLEKRYGLARPIVDGGAENRIQSVRSDCRLSTEFQK